MLIFNMRRNLAVISFIKLLMSFLTLVVIGFLPVATASTGVCRTEQWPLWSVFVNSFVTLDGRVIYSIPPKADTTSEGQAYAMFFALIANDPANFDKIWGWSVHHLFADDLDNNLPGWLWGKADDGSWKVLDTNSASDADMWFVYVLLEAGRLWQRADYIRDAQKILSSIEKNELIALPDFGSMLLPGKVGFVLANSTWRLNPSYLPISVIRRLAQVRTDSPWNEIAANTAKLISSVSPKGYIADWVRFQAIDKKSPQFVQDEIDGPRGSYDAIRVYLWAGMTAVEDPLASQIMKSLPGMLNSTALNGAPPESVDVNTGVTSGVGPYGFSAALLPYLHSLGATQVFDQQLARYRKMLSASLIFQEGNQKPPVYYDYSLSLFALGWVENRFRFLKDGQAKFNWEQSCFYPPVQ